MIGRHTCFVHPLVPLVPYTCGILIKKNLTLSSNSHLLCSHLSLSHSLQNKNKNSQLSLSNSLSSPSIPPPLPRRRRTLPPSLPLSSPAIHGGQIGGGGGEICM